MLPGDINFDLIHYHVRSKKASTLQERPEPCSTFAGLMDNGHTDRKSSIDSSRLFASCFEGGDAPRVEDMLSADPSLDGRADVLGGVPVCDEPFLCEKIAKKDMVSGCS